MVHDSAESVWVTILQDKKPTQTPAIVYCTVLNWEVVTAGGDDMGFLLVITDLDFQFRCFNYQCFTPNFKL